MIWTQTKALLIDAYRDLNSRKMFWIVLVLNVLVVAGFAALGVSNNRLYLLNWEIPRQDETLGRGILASLPVATMIYKGIFSYVIVGQWLTWVATILALISTASIFPDFMAGGSIDLYLSKPISRLRMFLTKYVTGLLFVSLQVAVFTAGSFLVLGWRAGIWEYGLFLAIPIVVLFFSYLFSMCVLFGVFTRSTLASFFLTLVAWGMVFGINASDRFLMQADDFYAQRSKQAQTRISGIDRQIADVQRRIDRAATRPAVATTQASLAASNDAAALRRLNNERDRQQQVADEQRPPSWVQTIQPILFAVDTAIPKTQDTISLLDRVLFRDLAMQAVLSATPREGPMHGWRGRVQDMLHGRSMSWILGSSIAFECAVLGLAAWRFCRRDY